MHAGRGADERAQLGARADRDDAPAAHGDRLGPRLPGVDGVDDRVQQDEVGRLGGAGRGRQGGHEKRRESQARLLGHGFEPPGGREYTGLDTLEGAS